MEVEDIEWEIEQIFKRYGIKYNHFAPLSYDFWIAEDAPHASVLYIAYPRKKRIVILLVLSKADNECPPILETTHIKREDIHYKPEPESKFCYYHMMGEDFTPKQLIKELKIFLRDTIQEEKKRREGKTIPKSYAWIKEKYG